VFSLKGCQGEDEVNRAKSTTLKKVFESREKGQSEVKRGRVVWGRQRVQPPQKKPSSYKREKSAKPPISKGASLRGENLHLRMEEWRGLKEGGGWRMEVTGGRE